LTVMYMPTLMCHITTGGCL